MKNFTLIFLILGLVLTSCKEDSISKQEKQAEKERIEAVEPVVDSNIGEPLVEPTPIPYYEPAATYTPMTTIPTYWYITFEEVTRDAEGKRTGSIDWHRAVKLNTPYFDFVEARKDFPPQCTGKCYFDFVTQISKESYDSWKDFKRIYHPK